MYKQKVLIGLSCAPVTVVCVCVTPQMKVACSVNYSSFCSLCVRVQRREMNVHILTFNIIWGRKYFFNFSGKISTYFVMFLLKLKNIIGKSKRRPPKDSTEVGINVPLKGRLSMI